MTKKAPARAKVAKPAKGKAAASGSKSAKPKAAKTKSKSTTAARAPKSAGKPAKPAAKRPAKSAPGAAAKKPAKDAKSGKPAKAATTSPKSAEKPSKKPATPGAKPAARTSGKTSGKPAGKAGSVAKPAKPAEAAAVDPNSKAARKGITIVSNKPRRSGPKQPKILIPKMEPLLGPGSPFRKPLIASGPGAVRKSLEIDPESLAKLKTPFGKKDLQRFRDILLKKRADLVGDVSDLESEALLGRSGSLSALPQHLAEQGSETYEQSLSLNLAAEDRRLIREIDAALQRVDKGTFGICEMTGKAISRERLDELPWTRYSIEAAREFERRSHGR